MNQNFKVLICEDDPKIQILADQILTKIGNFETTVVGGGTSLLEVYSERFDIVLLDIRLPDISGIELLQKLMKINPQIIIIMMTAYSTENLVIECLRLGAYNYIKKPFEINYLVSSVKEACIESRRLQSSKGAIIARPASSIQAKSKSEIIIALEEKIEKIAKKNLSILLTGESGTGKEYFAKLICEYRNQYPHKYIDVNCPAIPEALFESELFGHEKGSFTGATEQKIGKFELASNGTLFLDEIADLNILAQSKLLRVLQEREIVRVGGLDKVAVDFKLVSATSKNLQEMMKIDSFRPDLYYRICDIELEIPPLRKRLEDIDSLVENISIAYTNENKESKRHFSKEAIKRLKEYQWPGNIRELKSVIRRLLILHDDEIISEELIDQDLKKHFINNATLSPVTQGSGDDKEHVLSSATLDIQTSERNLIEKALEKCEYNLTKTAKELGFGRSTLYRKIKKYGIKT